MKAKHAFTTLLVALIVLMLPVGCTSSVGEPEAEDLITIWGGKGNSSGQFIKPRALVFSPRHRLYVVDLTGRIQSFTSAGKWLHSFRTPKIARGKPTGLGVSPQGNIYVADTHYHRILCYNPDGKLLFQFGHYGTAAHEFVYVTDVAVDLQGFIYVGQYGDALGKYDRIQKFSRNGRFLNAWGKRGRGPGEFERPMSIAVEADGNILVADACNHRIQRFTNNGQFIEQWGTPGDAPGQLRYPYGIAVAADGAIYVSEFGNNRIQKFTSAGKSLALFGMPGRFPGMFANPWDIAIGADGEIYVADALNHRIQKLAPQLFNPANF